MSSPSSSNRVLVIGSSGVGKKYLLRQLGAQTATSADATFAPAATAIAHHTLTLDTKYYTAERLSTGDRAAFAAQEVHAALLVFDRRRPATFHALASAWTTFLDDRQPEVAMLIGNAPTNDETAAATTDDAIASSPDELADLEQLARDWALDHSCEYVQMPFGDILQTANVRLAVPATAAASSSRPRSSSHNDSDDVDLQAANEPIGLARIRESLECNAWPQLTMKDRKSALKRAPIYSHDDEDEAEEEEQKSHANGSAVSVATSRMIDDSEEFAAFVSAIENNGSVAAAAPAATSTAAAPAATAAKFTVAATAKPAAASTAARSASASAFANAFAKAIRVPDTDTKSSPASTTSSNKPQLAATTTTAEHSADADEPFGRDASLDLLAERLTRLTPEEAAENKNATAAVVPVDEENPEDPSQTASEASMAAFEGLFEKVTAMKNELARASREGTMTDAERRAKAEANVRMLLKSLGMEGELDSDVDDVEEAEA